MSTFKNHHGPGREQFPESLGSKTSAESLSITFASDDSLSVDLGDTNFGTPGASTLRTASMLGVGSTAVSNSNPVPVSDAGGSLTVDGTVAATQSGAWSITNVSGTVSLPTGAATEATLAAQSAKLPATLGQKAMAASLAVALASDQSAIPVTQSGTWNVTNISGTVSLPTGAATEATLTSLNNKIVNGQTTMSGALSVVVASNQSAIAVAANNFPVTVATDTGATSVSTIRTVLCTRHENLAIPLAAQLSNGSVALAYDSGASSSATLRTVLATRHEAVATPLAAQLSNGSAALAYDSGAASSATLRTVLATRHESASSPLSVRITNGTAFGTPAVTGRAYADSVRKDYSAGSVTTGAWTQLIASTAATINELRIFDSSGQTMELGTGAGASETRVLLIPPGGFDSAVTLLIASGTRLSVRAVSATASTGELTISGLT
jgi:hypothetical protein